MREAVINHYAQLLQLGDVQKGRKGLAEENLGHWDCEQEGDMVVGSHLFLSCSQVPKLTCL